MSDEGPKRHGAGAHLGPSRTSPYPLSRLSAPHDLVDVARQVAEADASIALAAGGKLSLIARQIQELQEKARVILERAQKDAELHRVACSFEKRPGHTYHLYRRGSGELYFSMFAPDEWVTKQDQVFVGSYRLEADRSWTPADDVEARDLENDVTARLLGGGER